MYATYLLDLFRNAGLTVKPYPGWETRGGAGFTPKAVMWHHTVTKPTTADSTVDKMLAVTGSSSTPAPLCNYSTNRDGSISLIAAGQANHAGSGTWNGTTVGNRQFFGDEMKNLGTSVEPWPKIQLEAARVAAAAILLHLGQTDTSWFCGHKEWAPHRKTDPHTLNMTTERMNVAAIMEGDMGWEKPGDPVDNLEDARAVNKYQGWSFWREADFDYDENDPKYLDERTKIITARMIDWMMRHP